MTPKFTIELHKRDLSLLQRIQSFFYTQGNTVGSISVRGRDDCVVYSVTSISELTHVIIPHFESYPLISQKRADFLLFKLVVELINNKEHLTREGLAKIISLRASINKGLTLELSRAFPNVTPVERPVVDISENIDPFGLAGFSSKNLMKF